MNRATLKRRVDGNEAPTQCVGSAAKRMTKWKVLYFKPYNVAQTWGAAKTATEREKAKRSHTAGQIIEALRKQAIASPLPLVSWVPGRCWKLLCPLCAAKRGGMFGRLSGKRHFRAHSCHSPGTWILPQRVHWWGAGKRTAAFYLKMGSWQRTWCEAKTLISWYSHTHIPPRHPFSPSLTISSLLPPLPRSSVTGLNLKKQSCLCGERFPSRFRREYCFLSSASPWWPGIGQRLWRLVSVHFLMPHSPI